MGRGGFNTGFSSPAAAGILSGSVVDPSLLPPEAIIDTFEVASEVAMLALTAEKGDRALRTDLSATYAMQGDDPTNISDWVLLTSEAHASKHIIGGFDELDGDRIDIDWDPAIYSPDSSPAEVVTVNELTAHLKGIDNYLTGVAVSGASFPPNGPASGDLSGSYPSPIVVALTELSGSQYTLGAWNDGDSLLVTGSEISGTSHIGNESNPHNVTAAQVGAVATGSFAGGDLTGSYPNPTIAGSSVDGGKLATVVDGSTTAGALVIHPVDVPSGAAGDVDVTIDDKIEVIEMIARLNGTGTGGDSIQLKNSTSVITEDIGLAGGAIGDLYRSDNITAANAVVSATGTLRITKSTVGTFPGALVLIYAIRRV